MKQLIVVCFNDFAKKIINKIIEDNYYKLVIILDNKTNLKKYNGIKIDKISNIIKYKDPLSEIAILDDMPYNDEVYYQLYKLGIADINIITKEVYLHRKGIKFDIKNSQKYNLQIKPILKYIEMHIDDRCNLKCNGCTHFSNIVDKNGVKIIDFKKDIKQFSKLFNVPVIRLMGGEPFLNKDISSYLGYVRKCFPQSVIFIVSNGILIPKLDQEVLNNIKKHDIIVNITLYQATLKIMDKIQKTLNNNQINFYYGKGNDKIKESDIISNFHTCLSLNKGKWRDELNCYNQYCWFLKKGNIYKCPYPALIDDLSKKYNVEYDVTERDYIELNQIKNGWEVIKQLSKPIDFCMYCRNGCKSYRWNNTNKPKLSDYILGDD